MSVKILYVEDEVFLGRIVKESLETRAFHVHWVQDGARAIDAFRNVQPDICVLDIMLPNTDGFIIGQEIRDLDQHVPIIYLTAKDQTRDVLKGFSSGGNDYLKKPFSMEELIVRIENLLRLARNGQHSETMEQSFADCTFNPVRMELTVNGATHKLSHKENELLKILAAHINLPVERKRILKEVWGDDTFFNSRNLDVYITRLRKLFRDHDAINIITLKGVGYQFVVD